MQRQILFGSLIMAVSTASHITILVLMIGFLPELSARDFGDVVILGAAFVAILAGHTIEVWIWAFAFKWTRALETLEEGVYFALVTTTTLGYGDVTLAREWRIFGAMASVSGLMTFGLSTAFLIDVFARIYSP